MRTLIAGLALAVWCAACTPGADPKPADESRFSPVGVGVVRDSTTGLLWTTNDRGENLAWSVATEFCGALAIEGRDDWRLPDIEELLAIYDESQSAPCGDRACRLDPVFALTDPYVWTGTERGPGRRFYVDFKFGTKLAPLIRPTLLRRVLCVHADS